ncbi:MAG: response regulator [Actinomycetota bacterium]|nr:response regulator [Actinomycetota bacterium]
MKVLTVDDSRLIQRMYGLLFMKYKNCEVAQAGNGVEALEVLSHDRDFDMIILDMNMPLMNGLQFLEKMKELKHRHIPVVVISTEDKEKAALQAMKLGAWGYLRKPFKSEELYSLVDQVMAGSAPVLKTSRIC